MSEPVTMSVVDRTALVCINNPPVNAASHAVRQALKAAVKDADADPNIDVIVLYAAGRTFIAGADIKEFGKPPKDPWLPEVCNTIEGSTTPVIAVLHGTPLGGGLEVALAAHARVAVPGTKVGLPEVNLGILPGAGGTQRAPRLIGIPAALDIILSGRHVPVTEAVEMGLVDRIEQGPAQDVAHRVADLWRSGDLPTRRTGELTVADDPPALDAARRATQKKSPHLFSPLKCIDAIAASVLPIADGLERERALFSDCLNSPQRAGLIHAFFSERAVSKIPEASESPRPIHGIGVVGAGLMGSGIATACLIAGYSVVLVDQTEAALERGAQAVRTNLKKAVERGKLTQSGFDTRLNDRFDAVVSLDALKDADLVIEAIFEDMDAKRDLFKSLDRICKQGVILATNTSYLDINQIAKATSRPQDVIGLHFFSPAHIMKLMEVVVADATARDVVATGFAFAKALRKIAVRSGVCDGFIGNRILTATRKAADYMLLDGATPQDIDTALEAFGFAMGPYRVLDMAGLDISWANRKRQAATRSAEERYVTVGDQMCERGWLGRKSGCGYYVYASDGAVEPNANVQDLINQDRSNFGIEPRSLSAAEIVDRYMTAMVCEGTRVLEEGIASKPIDIDAVLLFGYGFPRFRGGPLHYADTLGAEALIARIEAYAKDDPVFWTVPPLLRQMAKDGTCFADLNHSA